MKAITEELCGHSVSASTVSTINQKLDADLSGLRGGRWRSRTPLWCSMHGTKIRDERDPVAGGAGGDRDQLGRAAVRAGGGAGQPGECVERKECLLDLRQRGLSGVEFVVSDDHPLRRAIVEVIPEAAWQRCYVHFLRNALDYLPRRGDDDCLKELRWIYDRRNLEEARRDLAVWLGKWQTRYPKLCDWVESNIEETLTFYRLPLSHHKHMKSTNMLERQHEEIKRRTRVVRIFPNAESCLQLIRALAIEMHENWIEDTRYLNMNDLREHKKEALRRLDAAA